MKNILNKKVSFDDLGKFLDYLDTICKYLVIVTGIALVVINLVR